MFDPWKIVELLDDLDPIVTPMSALSSDGEARYLLNYKHIIEALLRITDDNPYNPVRERAAKVLQRVEARRAEIRRAKLAAIAPVEQEESSGQ